MYLNENTIIHMMPDEIKPGVIYLTDDKLFAKKYISDIYDMMQKGYADKGGLIVKTEQELFDNIELMKIVFSDDLKILACFTYKSFAGGNKLYVGAGRRTDAGRNAIQEIIKSDIEPYDNWFWGEVSGPIEHYFKKHNGRPIPKELVHLFVGTKRNIVVSPDPNDPIHYTRKIGDFNNPIEKSMYGFKDEQMAKIVMESIDNYEDFRLTTNALPDKIVNESVNYLNDALSVIMEITELKEEFGFNELLPHWHTQLNNAITYMSNQLPLISDASLHRQVESSIKQGNLLKKYMPKLTMHKFEVSN